MTLDNINELMHQALEPVSQRWPGRLTIEELHASVPGYECPTDHRMVAVIEELLGTRTQVVNYCTEAPFVQQVCPTVLGPGSIDQAHQPDEYIDTAFIEPTRKLLGQLVNHFCRQ